MVKSVLGVNHQGLRDWLIQRVSAIVMAIFSVGMLIFFATHSDLAFYEWHGLFAQTWMKIATLLFFLSLLYHAWIGMWTIFTDYVKIWWLCVILNIAVILGLVACFLAALLILWGV
jgi:succinate dehydrogenase / fumarate reductase membrane anchor subunit